MYLVDWLENCTFGSQHTGSVYLRQPRCLPPPSPTLRLRTGPIITRTRGRVKDPQTSAAQTRFERARGCGVWARGERGVLWGGYNSTDSDSVRFKRVVRLCQGLDVCSAAEWRRGNWTTKVCSESVDSQMIPLLKESGSYGASPQSGSQSEMSIIS